MYFFNHFKYLVLSVFLLTALITAHSFIKGEKNVEGVTTKYTHYNNYVIFKQSFHHLIDNKDLYALYPEEQWDYFKYSPTFSLLMAPMALCHDWLGLLMWNFLNAFILLLALWKLPNVSINNRLIMLGIVLIELITSLQNSQSNALIGGLIVLGCISIEKKQFVLGTLLIALTVYIKIFGVFAFILVLFYPERWKAIGYSFIWMLVLFVLPILVISVDQLLFLYKSWASFIVADLNSSYGISFAGFLHAMQLQFSSKILTAIGIAVLLLPLGLTDLWKQSTYRMMYLASMLIWLVVFNNKAESPTYIIAVIGVAIWYIHSDKNLLNNILLGFTILLTILSPTDVFPTAIREHYIVPYSLKALPCVLVWLKVVFDMFKLKYVHYGGFISLQKAYK